MNMSSSRWEGTPRSCHWDVKLACGEEMTLLSASRFAMSYFGSASQRLSSAQTGQASCGLMGVVCEMCSVCESWSDRCLQWQRKGHLLSAETSTTVCVRVCVYVCVVWAPHVSQTLLALTCLWWIALRARLVLHTLVRVRIRAVLWC